jgi:hypothetical protein
MKHVLQVKSYIFLYHYNNIFVPVKFLIFDSIKNCPSVIEKQGSHRFD